MQITLKLNTSYSETGNETGEQIDTLAGACKWSTQEECREQNLEYLDKAPEYALEDHDYESDFIDTLTKKQRKQYANNLEAFNDALEEYKQAIMQELRANYYEGYTELAKECQQAYSEAEKQLMQEWLYGDYREHGLLGEARKVYGGEIDFHYNNKEDEITADVSDDYIEELKEYGHIDRKSKKQVADYLNADISSLAVRNWQEEQEKRAKRREEYLKTQAYKEKRAEEERQALRDKLLNA